MHIRAMKNSLKYLLFGMTLPIQRADHSPEEDVTIFRRSIVLFENLFKFNSFKNYIK